MKLGIVSAGRIVREFLPQWKAMGFLELTGICVRPQSEDAGKALAAEYGIGRVYTDYAVFLAENEMDAVYIGSTNQMHYPQAKAALLAGHNVILEKPMAGSLAQVTELFAIAEEKHVRLMEAITTFYLPGFAFLREHLDSIRPVRLVMANFSKRSSQYDKYLAGDIPPSFDPACLGGALNDMNIYNLHLVLGLLGKPESVEYLPSLGGNGVDVGGTALLRYEDFTAVLSSYKDSTAPSYCHIQGENGLLKLEGMPNALEQVSLWQKDRSLVGPSKAEPLRMWEEFAAFDRILRGEEEALYTAATAQSLLVMEVLDKLHK